MTIGPNEDGADKLQEYHESIPCPTCGAKESEYARLIIRIKELEGKLNSWACKGHADWCCGEGDMCCCGHEQVPEEIKKMEAEEEG